MKRTAFVTLLFGIALFVAPAAQAHVMADDSAGGGSVVLSSDSATGGAVVRSDDAAGGGGVVFQVDKLGGSGESEPVPIQPDVLGGDGGSSTVETAPPTTAPADSFAWGPALAVMLFVAMLLALSALVVTRRRHRLSF